MGRGLLLGGGLPPPPAPTDQRGPARRYGMYSPTAREFLSFGGRALVHWCPHELAFLFAGFHQIREIPAEYGPQHRLEVAAHPAMSHVRFPPPGQPLDRTQFRRTTT